MKPFYLFLFLIFCSFGFVFAQTESNFNYQAVLRDASGNLISNQEKTILIEILKNNTSGEIVFTESHSATTNQFGMVNLLIGSKSNLNTIRWNEEKFFIKITVDGTHMGIFQLLSVPYAIHSKTADSLTIQPVEKDPVFNQSIAKGIASSDTSKWNSKLESFTELDPLFDLSIAKGITSSDTSKWNSKLDSFTELDPLFDLSIAKGISANDTSNWNRKLDQYTETDPNFSQSVAKGITSIDTAKWNNKLDYFIETDGDSLNEIQTLSISNNQLSISNGNSISLPTPETNSVVPVLTSTEILALDPIIGQSVYNNTESLYQIYDGIQWVSILASCWPQPSPAYAGDHINFTNDSVIVQLNANIPEENHGTGKWIIVSGDGGSFEDENDPNTVFHGNSCKDYTIKWQITTSCGISEHSINVVFFNIPTPAYAGEDILIIDGTTSTNLNANSPEANHGTGRWFILSGEGGSFINEYDPKTQFNGIACNDYRLKWTISTSCDISEDSVYISFFQPVDTANAGENQFFTDGTTSTHLAANNPGENKGIGSWSILSGNGGAIEDALSPTTLFTGIFNEVYMLKWTISATCGVTKDSVRIRFKEPGPPVSDYEGNEYSTVWIGDQLWMSENLKATKLNDGTLIPNVTDGIDWSNLTSSAYCWYSNNISYKNTYGALYNWYTVNTNKLCPTGWHVPSKSDWETFESYLIVNGYNYDGSTEGNLLGKAVSSKNYWQESIEENIGAIGNNKSLNNSSGFNALPGGYLAPSFYVMIYEFYGNETESLYWTSDSSGSQEAWSWLLYYENPSSLLFSNAGKNYGSSVRCVKD